MDPRLDTDAVSLRDLDDAEPTAATEPDPPRLNIDVFTSYKRLIESAPVLTKSSRQWMGLPRWKQRQVLILLYVFTTFILHNALVSRLSTEPVSSLSTSSSYGRILSAVLGALLIIVVSRMVMVELHHIHQLPRAMNNNHSERVFAWLLLLTCCASPYLCQPIYHSYDLAHHTQETDVNDPIGYATLSKWGDIIPTLSGSLPSLYDLKETGERVNVWSGASADRWIVMSSDIKAQFPDSITFNLPGAGRGPNEHHWNGQEDYGDRIGVYKPVLPTKQIPFDRMQYSHKWQIKTEALGSGLECEYISQDQISVLGSPEGGSYSFTIGDASGCSTEVVLNSIKVGENMHAAVLEHLLELEKEARHAKLNAPAQEAVLGLINHYRDLLSYAGGKVAYKPVWAHATHTTNRESPGDCGSKLFLATTSRSFLQEDAEIQPSSILAASCMAKFSLVDATLELSKVFGKLHNEAPVRPASVAIDRIEPLEEVYKSRHLDDDSSLGLSEAFLQQATQATARQRPWSLAHLTEEFRDAYWGRARPVGCLVLIGHSALYEFVGKLSTAAGLMLQENLPTAMELGNESRILHFTTGARIEASWMHRWVFQSGLGFASLFFITGSALFISLAATQRYGRESFEDYYEGYVFRWNVSSIASRAALLRHSSVKDWLVKEVGLIQFFPFITHLKPPHGLHVGYWSVHEKQGKSGWRLDSPGPRMDFSGTRSKQEEEGNDEATQKNGHPTWPWYISRGVGLCVAIALLLFALLQLPMLLTSSLASSDYSQPRLAQQLIILLDLGGTIGEVSIFWILISSIFPATLLFIVAFFWLPLLFLFYVTRQPWASMKTSQPAHLSITLDYWNSWFPLGRAIAHRHWEVGVLALASVASLAIPLASTCLYTPVYKALPTETFTGTRPFGWRENISQSTFIIGSSTGHALPYLVEGLVSSKKWSDWASVNGVLASFNKSEAWPTRDALYGVYDTHLISGSLHCHKVRANITTSTHDISGKVLYKVEQLDLALGTSKEVSSVSNPCTLLRTYEHSHPGGFKSLPSPQRARCGRWLLRNTTSSPEVIQPEWSITMIEGTVSAAVGIGDLLFDKMPSAVGLQCRPVVKTTPGTATMLVNYDGDHIDDGVSVVNGKFNAFGASKEHQNIASAASLTLNASIQSLSRLNDGITADDDLLSNTAFVGDLMSYLLHRFWFADSTTETDERDLAEAASLLYSGYISALASTTDLLKDFDRNESFKVRYFNVRPQIAVNWAIFAFLFVYFMMCVFILVKLGFSVPRKFQLPVSPEPLWGSLRILCLGGLVERMERDVPEPDTISLSQFHKHVESWGLRYKLDTVDGFLQVVVSDPAEVDDAEAYVDEPNNNSDENVLENEMQTLEELI
ncbi:hypothetical protein B0I35DRAFT_509951 [Stachybotrys elegans]|uniref:Uncharacterized protein n=1 Tax=Stachybotrys elegans TaxID=80388 RepID=A0A8K0WU01_9HYPO|nr:hypothetical protein B0I35DRAFT_509951 [Stachybotrys elegans]